MYLLFFGLGIAAIGLLSVILQILAIIDIIRSEFRSPNDKIIWIVVCIFFSFIGPILYFVFGQDQKVYRDNRFR